MTTFLPRPAPSSAAPAAVLLAGRSARAPLALALCAAAISGCENGTGPVGEPGVTIVSGAQVADTVLTRLAQPLVVEVRDEAGRLVHGVVVRFQPVPADTRPPWFFPVDNLSLRAAAEGPSAPMVLDTTDASGRASAWVSFGVVAGEAAVTINVPALSLDARATYTIHPGDAVGVRAEPRDSALYVGGAYTVRGATIDWYGNLREDPVTFASPAIHLDLADDGTITGESVGRDLVVVAHGEWRDTARVSVVPRGRLAAFKLHVATGDTAGIVELGLDGSGWHETELPYWADGRPDWMPDGALLYEDGGTLGGGGNHILVRDQPGVPARRLVPAELELPVEHHAQATADGAWIFFTAGYPSRQDHAEIWRIRPDGSDAERVGEPAGHYEGDMHPSPSPDGSRVAYATDRHSCCGDVALRILDVATGTIDTLMDASGTPLLGSMPRWSPTGERIAYVASMPERSNIYAKRIWIMRPDGTDRRVVSGETAYRPAFDWSPDGEWLVARSFDEDRLELIHVESGLVLPLGYTARLSQPAWHP